MNRLDGKWITLSLLSLLLLVFLFTSCLEGKMIRVSSDSAAIPDDGSEEGLVIVNLNEEDLEGEMWWNGFHQSCKSGGSPLDTGGFFSELRLHLEVNLYEGTITGSLDGDGSDSFGESHVNVYSFKGTVVGAVEKAHQADSLWYWELSGSVLVDLDFHMRRKCKDSATSEECWVEKGETLHVNATLSATTYSDTQKLAHLSIWWADQGGIDDGDRRLRVYTYERDGDVYIPIFFTDPIDLDVSLSGPSEIASSTGQAIFELDASGRDLDMIEQLAWHLHYYDGDFPTWFEGIAKQDTSPLVVGRDKLDDWMELANEHGTPSDGALYLKMEVGVWLYASDERQLVEPATLTFTYTSESRPVNRITGFMKYPLKHIEIKYRSDTQKLTATTDEQGYYELPTVDVARASCSIIAKIKFPHENQHTFRYILGA